ncbi:MAG: L-threonylcarbamoyladenylate synthase [Desulfovibrionales bacterium]
MQDPAIVAGSRCIRKGGCLIYPTETFYALGGNALDPALVDRVFRLKARPGNKPLPLIIGHFELLSTVAASCPPELDRVVSRFWPGPLSVLLPARRDLPDPLTDSSGYVCVRWTPHPLAAALSRESGTALVATSANRSGMPAVADPKELDPGLVSEVDMVFSQNPRPLGQAPSTIVRFEGVLAVTVIRVGAVSAQELERAGFIVLPSQPES